jgi:hypothetical protein
MNANEDESKWQRPARTMQSEATANPDHRTQREMPIDGQEDRSRHGDLGFTAATDLLRKFNRKPD